MTFSNRLLVLLSRDILLRILSKVKVFLLENQSLIRSHQSWSASQGYFPFFMYVTEKLEGGFVQKGRFQGVFI